MALAFPEAIAQTVAMWAALGPTLKESSAAFRATNWTAIRKLAESIWRPPQYDRVAS
jgi:hypothetical protein